MEGLNGWPSSLCLHLHNCIQSDFGRVVPVSPGRDTPSAPPKLLFKREVGGAGLGRERSSAEEGKMPLKIANYSNLGFLQCEHIMLGFLRSASGRGSPQLFPSVSRALVRPTVITASAGSQTSGVARTFPITAGGQAGQPHARLLLAQLCRPDLACQPSASPQRSPNTRPLGSPCYKPGFIVCLPGSR